jgi:hypothetical protein
MKRNTGSAIDMLEGTQPNEATMGDGSWSEMLTWHLIPSANGVALAVSLAARGWYIMHEQYVTEVPC